MAFIKKNRVFIDIDGTLAKWQWGANWQAPHYFRHLPRMKNMVRGITEIMEEELVEVIFLTCSPSDEAMHDKMAWLQETFPGMKIQVIFVPYGENKGDYVNVTARDVLVDDFSPNLHAWKGRTVKVFNGLNGRHGTYAGRSVKSSWEPRVIAETILEAADSRYEVA